MAQSSIAALRRQATLTSLRTPTDLAGVIDALGFIQADPIQAPARAQDLILRQRVASYRVGDLERLYPKLGVEEDFLYAYGFMPRRVAALLHPRPASIEGFAAELLAFVRSRKATHPRDLEEAFGKKRAVNNWGGFSKATTQALHDLHFAGALRVVARQNGVRLYGPSEPPSETLDNAERAQRLILLVLGVLAPISTVSLRSTLSLMKRGTPGLTGLNEAIARLRRDGAIEAMEVEGETYLSPVLAQAGALDPKTEAPDRVRILAPFDPIVWDRRRFDHLWGWRYRFEAYVPPKQRQLGYYAMPLLWRDQVIGWANSVKDENTTILTTHFIVKRPTSRTFDRALDQEIARIDRFLTSKSGAVV